jgi:hypothetical protein
MQKIHAETSRDMFHISYFILILKKYTIRDI